MSHYDSSASNVDRELEEFLDTLALVRVPVRSSEDRSAKIAREHHLSNVGHDVPARWYRW